MVKRIAVTGGGGQIAYSLLFRLAAGELFGEKEEVILSLSDLPEMEKALEGVTMELEDCAFPLLKEIRPCTDPKEAFEKSDCVFLVGAKPRGPGMERADLLKDNGKIFVTEGRALNEAASKNVKVLVVGNPCNTNCLIAMHAAPSIPRENFHAMMRLDQNRAQALLAKKAKVSVTDVKKMIIWGNHSASQVPDFTNARIREKRTLDVISDVKWLKEEFMSTVQKRGAAIIAARGKSSAASAANAAIDAMRDVFFPTSNGEWYTSAVITDSNPYGIEKNLIFGFPCRTKQDGSWEIVPNLPLDTFIHEKIKESEKELLEEREFVKQLLLTH